MVSPFLSPRRYSPPQCPLNSMPFFSLFRKQEGKLKKNRQTIIKQSKQKQNKKTQRKIIRNVDTHH